MYNGGSAAVIGLALKGHARRLWLYDSFRGLPPAGDRDGPQVAWFTGELVGDLAAVRRRLAEVGLSADSVVIREGWFDETFALPAPDQVALLHVDADWYEGVRSTLGRFYDAVVDGGVVVLDDFPWWEGTRRAFYEFCVERDIAPIAHRHGLTGALYWYKGETYERSHATRRVQSPQRPGVASLGVGGGSRIGD
ncbi:MAG: TylF/MycF/NovP-related O-methyltransferase [Pseudonocardiaceae bacterium]